MCDNYAQICELPVIGNIEANASVAVLDSVYELPAGLSEDIELGHTEDFVGRPNLEDTTGHGKGVNSILYGSSKNVEFNFYRVVRENGVILQRDLLKAIGTAHKVHEVDVIHLSLGFDHSKDGVSCDMPNEPCKVRSAAKQAVDDNITVVAAAGNADPADEAENDNGVCCPALLNEVISVGGMFPACTATFEESHSASTINPNNTTLPPLACWIKEKGTEETGTPICSGLGCSPKDSCDDNRIVTEWEGNVNHEPSEIDILAPVVYPIENRDHEPDITSGTSYAAPFVTGLVAEITALLKENNEQVDPTQIQAAIANTAEPVERGNGRYLQGESALKRITERKGIRVNLSRRPDYFRFE